MPYTNEDTNEEYVLYTNEEFKRQYEDSLHGLEQHGLISSRQILTPRGENVVARCFHGLDQLVIPLYETLTLPGVIPDHQNCEYDRARYILTCALWKDFTPEERATLEASAGRASLHKSALPLLAATHVLNECIRVSLISSYKRTLNLVRTPTERFMMA